MLKYIYTALAAGVIITLNVIWGSAISWFLSLTILAIVFYFVIQLQLEDIVNTVFEKKSKDITKDPNIGHKLFIFSKKWESILKFSALALVFVLGVWCINTTTNPMGNDTWFLNNDYHGLSNSGIAFNKQMKLVSTSTDSNARQGTIRFSDNNGNAQLRFEQFYIPVFKSLGDRKTTLLNNIFPQNIQQRIHFKNADFDVDIAISPYEVNFFKQLISNDKDGLTFDITLQCNNTELLSQWNLKAPYTDQINILSGEINIGKQLYELLLNARSFESQKPESYQVLETMLQELGDSYFLADHNEDEKSYKFFPGKQVIDNKYTVRIDGTQAIPQLTNTADIAFADKFYIGFNNYRKQLFIDRYDAANYQSDKRFTTALYFDYPNTYMLKSPGAQEAGNKNIRFVTNDLNKIIDNDLKEGFLFNTYQLATQTPINGSIDYFAGQPNTALHINVADFNASSASEQISNQKFTLLTKDQQQQYLFQLRDFSDNGFCTEKNIFYLGLIFLSFVLLQLFFPGKKLERIEPIILMVIMALAVLRFILYWRVATFPPLENISKYELENTLLNFDFNLGFQLPIPLTLVWILGMVALLMLYRSNKFQKWTPHVDAIFKKINPRLNNINIQYIAFLALCLVTFYLNKKILHIEILTRIISILIPILAYVYFSGRANALFQYQSKPLLYGGKKKWAEHLHALIYYFFNNPTAIITLSTLLFFGITDRGFAILFFLFLLLKNILVNFLKKPLSNTKVAIGNRLFMPQNFWIYGLIALAIYLTLLSVKPMFYYLLTYKVWVVFGLLLLTTIVLRAMAVNAKIQKASLVITVIIGLIAVIPVSNRWMDKQMSDVVKHVQYRASIIYQPIHELLQENEYTSFKTRKIIETAENQWFINSYISKPYKNDETINLRAHSRIGVDYSTQTRDVVLARYVISEWGNFSMYLILLLLIIPMVFYLIGFQFTLATNNHEERNIGSYTGLIPLLILFTIALFVWLTATNRFVFFGQDFPFLSLTSKLSVLIPLLLWSITLMQQPSPKHSFHVDIRSNSIKYLVFIGLIAVFALTTVQKNELNNDNFSIVMETTRDYIDNDLNAILANIQDGMESRKERISYNKVINLLAADTNFIELKNKQIKDKYTKSILDNLIQKPATAFQLDNPLFMVYDNGRYTAAYNKNLYLELPPIENRKIWQGNILEATDNANVATALLYIDKTKTQVTLPYFSPRPTENYQIAVIPKSWVKGAQDNVGILNIINATQPKTSVFIYKNAQKNMVQHATSFASTLHYDDMATIYRQNNTYQVGFQAEGHKFATNKWINGNYKIIYPLRSENFWIYSYANAIRSAYSNDSMLLANNYITLDYQLSSAINTAIQSSADQSFGQKHSHYNFSVIGADGNGHIRFMNDYVNDRRIIDPNDNSTIFAIQRQQFFYSNAKHERDQWGNRNLLNLYLGPGSTIKPLTAGFVASQVNAGWENLRFTPVGGDRPSYAGFKMIKPWINDEHYYGAMGIPEFIAQSSNFYHSLYMFLGSYTKEDFLNNERYSLKNVLTQQPGNNNNFPVVHFQGSSYYFKNYKSKAWPYTDKTQSHKSYFGNENSLLANGFELNGGLRTKDKDKLDQMATTNDRVSYVDPYLSDILSRNKNTGYLWSFPEESYFLQSDRAHKEIHQNFNLGMMTPSLGGAPFRVTPYKMAEMYLSMFTQNNNLQLSIVPQERENAHWNVDATWGRGFNDFMASNVFLGMKQVITSGTARRLGNTAGKYSSYYFYAKTGTINEQASGRKSSRRLIITITDKDMTQAANIGSAKVYALYFVTDNTRDFDWDLIYQIIDLTVASKSFRKYFENS